MYRSEIVIIRNRFFVLDFDKGHHLQTMKVVGLPTANVKVTDELMTECDV
jgi:hypothetical protein